MLARHTARLALIAALLTLARPAGWCLPCKAQTGTVHQVTGNGVTFTADVRWVKGHGYRPVRITVVPLVPPVADRTLKVEFLVCRNWRDQYDLRVVQEIEIPAGSGPVEATMAVPQYVDWSAYRINVSEDGRLRTRLSTNGWVRLSNRADELAECLPAVVVVGGELPDTSALAASLSTHISIYQQYSSDNVPANCLPTLATRTAGQLPRRWIDYSSVDILCMSLDELAALRSPDPQKFRAVCQWVSAGGNLWVYGIGDDWRRIGRLEGLLGLPPGAGDDTPDPLARGWQEPNARQYGKPVRGAISGSPPMTLTASATGRPAARPRSLPGGPEFLLRRYDAGLVVALAAGDPFPGQPAQWAWLLNSMGSHRWLWYQRHGVSMQGTNPNYWEFLIPDVGLAPVVEFCVLITLFVLGIGPLNYWLLRRWGRIHLLVVTIPGSAALVTFLLFAYALVSDGLGTRVRVRSVTYLDQRRGQAACWSRLSYYAGLAPSRGMEFPADVVVLPLEFIPPAAANSIPGGSGLAREPRDLIWREDQRLVSGWLRSRTPAQYLTVRSRASRVGLDVVASAGGGLRVTNGLTTPIRQLLLRSLQGDYYWVSDLEADGTAKASPIEPGEGLQRLAKTHAENRPRLPPRLDQQNYGGMFGMPNRMYYAFSSSGRQIVPVTQQTGRLERSLAQLTGGSAADPAPLAPGCYCAVVEQSPEVVLGVRGAREEESYHVIFGRW